MKTHPTGSQSDAAMTSWQLEMRESRSTVPAGCPACCCWPGRSPGRAAVAASRAALRGSCRPGRRCRAVLRGSCGPSCRRAAPRGSCRPSAAALSCSPGRPTLRAVFLRLLAETPRESRCCAVPSRVLLSCSSDADLDAASPSVQARA